MKDFIPGKKTYTGIGVAIIMLANNLFDLGIPPEYADGIGLAAMLFAAYGRKVARL